MYTSHALVTLAAAFSLGCATASAPLAPPESSPIGATNITRVSIGPVSATDLLRTLPPALARHGYFIVRTEQLAPDRYKFLTDWRAAPNSPTRTRLVLDVRRRGGMYALAIQGVSYSEDEAGWRELPASKEMVQHVRAIGTDLAHRVQ